MVEGKKPKTLIFIHSSLDEAGLDVYEFRLLSHIARRGTCFASLETTAEICKMSIRKAQYALKSLEKAQLIVKTPRKGRSTVYKLARDFSDEIQKLNPKYKSTPTPDEEDF